MDSRREEELLERQTIAVERQADAYDKLVDIATREEMIVAEPGPSICPHCGKLNPTITVLDNDGSGPIDEYLLAAETHCCNRPIFAIPDSWIIAPSQAEAESIMEMKGRAGQ